MVHGAYSRSLMPGRANAALVSELGAVRLDCSSLATGGGPVPQFRRQNCGADFTRPGVQHKDISIAISSLPMQQVALKVLVENGASSFSVCTYSELRLTVLLS
jgi:hypothetical protein